jgi:hypothetical protein
MKFGAENLADRAARADQTAEAKSYYGSGEPTTALSPPWKLKNNQLASVLPE